MIDHVNLYEFNVTSEKISTAKLLKLLELSNNWRIIFVAKKLKRSVQKKEYNKEH